VGARSAFVKVNSDPSYRAKFLKDPIGVLKSEGITLSAKDTKQLLETIEIIRSNVPDLSQLPAGYSRVINAVDKKTKDRMEGDPGPLVV